MNNNEANKRESNDKISSQDKQNDRNLSILIFIFSCAALLISIVPVVVPKMISLRNPSSSTTSVDWWSFGITIGLFSLSIVIAVIIFNLYRKKRDIQRKQLVTEREYNAAKRKNEILQSVFHSLHDANSGKISGTLRYTYGRVSEWNPINYEKNRLVYDVHDQLRAILKSLQRVVINIDPVRFSDKNVSVDLVYCYPENNNDCILPIVQANQNTAIPQTKKKWRMIADSPIAGNQNQFKIQKSDKPWKLISSGDLSGNHKKTLDYLKDSLSFYSLVSFTGSWFANRKYQAQKIDDIMKLYKDHLEEDCHMIISDDLDNELNKKVFFKKNVRDYENAKYNSTSESWDGSAIGATICVRNDNPEHVLVKAILTINTYGEPIFVPTTDDAKSDDAQYDKYSLTEDEYKQLFLKDINGAYCTLIASELSQMYIRHQLYVGKMNPLTGAPIKKTNNL